MNLDTIQNKLVKRMFAHLKEDAQTKQTYITNGKHRFIEYMSERFNSNLVCDVTDTWALFQNKENQWTNEGMTEEHHLEMQFLELLDDRDYCKKFGRLVAEKLISYYDQTTVH